MDKKYDHLKYKLDLISKDAPIRTGENDMIELDPDNKDHNEWFEDDVVVLKNRLVEALIKFSDEQLSDEEALELANTIIKHVDFSNSTLAHKGINWYVKDLLKRVNFDNRVAEKKKQMTTEKKRQMFKVGGSVKTNNYIDADAICREVRGK